MDESRSQQLIHRRMWFEYALRHLTPAVPSDDHRAEGIRATIARIDAELREVESAPQPTTFLDERSRTRDVNNS